MPKSVDPFDSLSLFKTYPDSTLRDLARNDCVLHDHRKLAVEILLNRRSPLSKHEDLRAFVLELKAELDGIDFDQPVEETGPGPLTSSVTTATMFGSEEVIDNGPQSPQEAVEPVQVMDESGEQNLTIPDDFTPKSPRKKKVPDAAE